MQAQAGKVFLLFNGLWSFCFRVVWRPAAIIAKGLLVGLDAKAVGPSGQGVRRHGGRGEDHHDSQNGFYPFCIQTVFDGHAQEHAAHPKRNGLGAGLQAIISVWQTNQADPTEQKEKGAHHKQYATKNISHLIFCFRDIWLKSGC